MSKLTLSVDKAVIARAKRYAKQQGTSVSGMVESYLDAISESGARIPTHVPPILRAVRGSLKKADLNEYKKHLAAKYQ